MIEVDIVERVKDLNGRCYLYVLRDLSDDSVLEISANDLYDGIEFGEYVVKNATYIQDIGFRVEEGNKIKTTVQSLPEVTGMKFQVPAHYVSDFDANCDYHGSQFINVCKKVRRLAIAHKIDVSPALLPHSSNMGNNIHLVKLIESCGVDIKEFLVGYLSVLQPYCLDYFERKKTLGTTNIWVCDVGYRVKLLIKIYEGRNGESLLVSFHESTIRGRTLTQSLGREDFSDNHVP